jgi:hypothetical protein
MLHLELYRLTLKKGYGNKLQTKGKLKWHNLRECPGTDLQELGKIMRYVRHDGQSPSRDLKLAPPE